MEEANFQYPQLEYIPEVEEFVDMSPDDQEPIGRSNLVDKIRAYLIILNFLFFLSGLFQSLKQKLFPTKSDIHSFRIFITD